MHNARLKILVIVEENEKFAIKNRGYSNDELRHLGNMLVYKADRAEHFLNNQSFWRKLYDDLRKTFRKNQ